MVRSCALKSCFTSGSTSPGLRVWESFSRASTAAALSGRAACAWDARPGALPLREWHFQGKGERRYRRGLAVWASPAAAVVDGRPTAFIGGCDQTLYALDLENKERRWFKITNGEIADAPAVGTVDGRPVVFWGSADRYVYAHRADDGSCLWTRELVAPVGQIQPQNAGPKIMEVAMIVTGTEQK